MKCRKDKKLNSLNFNLKKEIFLFLQAKDIIGLISLSQSIKFAVENIKLYKIIKEKLIN